MKNKKFIRRNWTKASRLGKRRKKKQVWRAPKGRHSKTRMKRKGYPIKVMVGFKQSQKEKAKPTMISNVRELEKVKKGETVIIGKMGKKKKIQVAKLAKEKGVSISNLNVNKILKRVQKQEEVKNKKQEKKK